MTDSTAGKADHLASLLSDIASSSRETVAQLGMLNNSVREATTAAKLLLCLRKNELRDQKASVFLGKSGPKQRLVELYDSIGAGKTRRELVTAGLPEGTVRPYCIQLIAESLLRVKEVRANGEEVLGYTLVEELCQLSQHLAELVEQA